MKKGWNGKGRGRRWGWERKGKERKGKERKEPKGRNGSRKEVKSEE